MAMVDQQVTCPRCRQRVSRAGPYGTQIAWHLIAPNTMCPAVGWCITEQDNRERPR